MRIWNSLRYCALTSLAAMALSASEHHGQVNFGGLPLPGATVTAAGTGKKLVTISDPQGAYAFADLPDGDWTITVEMLCFSPLMRTVTVARGVGASEWDLKLLPIAEINAASVKPEATAPISLSVSNNAPQQSGKKKLSVAAANTPGGFQKTNVNAASATALNPAPQAPPEAGEDLNQRAADGFLITGSNNNGASSPFSLAAAFGNSRKGPGSLYNGDIGFITDNSAFDARSFSLTGQDTAKPAYSHLTGLLSFGGPIKIPHLLRSGPNFVVNYQWTRDRNAFTQPGRMPTEAERAGDFSQSPNTVFDPSTGVPFPGNRIPQNRISPQAKSLLGLYPLPNFDGSSRYNYQLALTGATHQDNLQTRLNKTIGRKDQFSGAFAYQSIRTDNTNLFGFLDTTDSMGINASVNWRHNLTTHLSTNLGYQFSRLATRITPYFENRVNVSGQAGISGNDQNPLHWGPPSLVFSSGIASLSDSNQSLTRNQTSALSIAAYWNHARHNVSFGGDLRRQQFNLLSQQNPRGIFTFTGAATGAAPSDRAIATAGSDFAGFLLGIPDTSAVAFGNADKYLRAWANDAFIADDWRISPGLTVNAGVRWEYGSPITELFGRLVNLDLTPGYTAESPVIASHAIGALTGEKYPSSLVRPDKLGFQPRIGVSWRPFPASSMVVRAGYGIYYNSSVYQTIATQMAQQAPLSKNLSVQNSAATPLTIADGFNAAPGVSANTFAVDPNFRVGYAHNWQLSVQRDLPGAFVMSATYLGIKGTRGVQIFLPNTFPTGATNPCASCPAGFSYLTSNGNSTRESGQLQLRRRLHSGFTGSLQYTFSKSIDDAALGGRGQGAAVIAQDWLNLRGERGLSSFDQRHLLTLQLQYTTGMGIAGGTLANGRVASLLKEWTFSSQVNAGSGLPLTPVYPGAVNGTGVTGSIRPDYTGASLYDAPQGLFLNPAAYAAPAVGHWGNAGRDSIKGPAQFTLNASFGRTFRLADRFSLDVRIDSTNAINHVTYLAWNTNVLSGQFGLPTAANSMRSVQTVVRARF